MRRLGAREEDMLSSQSNLASTYAKLGRLEEALRTSRDVYAGRLKLHGEENERTLRASFNYASYCLCQKRFNETKSLLRKTLPIARRVLGDNNRLTLKMRWVCSEALYKDDGATLDEVREAVTILEDAERIARRVLGGAHPITKEMGNDLGTTRAVLLRACETLSPPGSA